MEQGLKLGRGRATFEQEHLEAARELLVELALLLDRLGVPGGEVFDPEPGQQAIDVSHHLGGRVRLAGDMGVDLKEVVPGLVQEGGQVGGAQQGDDARRLRDVAREGDLAPVALEQTEALGGLLLDLVREDETVLQAEIVRRTIQLRDGVFRQAVRVKRCNLCSVRSFSEVDLLDPRAQLLEDGVRLVHEVALVEPRAVAAGLAAVLLVAVDPRHLVVAVVDGVADHPLHDELRPGLLPRGAGDARSSFSIAESVLAFTQTQRRLVVCRIGFALVFRQRVGEGT